MSWLTIGPDGVARPADPPSFPPATSTSDTLLEMFGPRPGPAPLAWGEHRRVVWVVKQASGGNVRVLAERHRGIPRPDGTELRLYDGDEDVERRVATFRTGSWHWCVAESALEPKLGEQ